MCCYAFSRQIVVDPTHVGASGVANVPIQDQANYPMMISGVYSYLANTLSGGHVQQLNGADIIFASDPQGVNILPFERAAYNPTTGAVEFYVLISNLSHTTNTVIYMLYGSACGDQQNPAGVWIDNYSAVYHFGDGITLNTADSTGNGNNGVPVNAPTAGATLTGGAGGSMLLTAASSQYVDCGSTPSTDNISSGNGVSGFANGWVIQFVLNANSDPANATHSPAFVTKYAGGTGGWGTQESPVGFQDPGAVTEIGRPLDGDSFGENENAFLSQAVGNKVYYWWVTLPADSTTLSYAYRNGTAISAQAKGRVTNAVNPSPGVHMLIGNAVQSLYGGTILNSFYDGFIDEVRIRRAPFVGGVNAGANSVRNRINVEINNIIFTSSFYTIGSEVATTALSVSPSGTLLPGVVGTPYSQTFTPSGGTGPYTFVVDSGTLPPGLSLSSGGVISGTPSVAGTFNFTVRALDSATGCGTAAITISTGGVAPSPPSHSIQTLRYEIPKKRWFAHSYADPIVFHYLDEVFGNNVNSEQLLLLSQGLGFIYKSGGDTDNGTAITTTITTPSMDGGEDRMQKLYVDVMSDADQAGSVTVTALFNNQTVLGGNVTFTTIGARAQYLQNISSLAALNLYRNIALTYQWTGGPDGPRIYVSEPAGYIQPYISTFMVTQIINLSFPGWKHHRRLYAGYISNSALLFTIKTQDGRTYGPYTLPSTGGQFQIIELMLDQNIKDLAFGYQIDGQGQNFVLFPEAFTIETKAWNEPSFIDLAIFKT